MRTAPLSTTVSVLIKASVSCFLQRITRVLLSVPDLVSVTMGVLSISSTDSTRTHSVPAAADAIGVDSDGALLEFEAFARSPLETLNAPTAISPKKAAVITPAQPPNGIAVGVCPTRGPVGRFSTRRLYACRANTG